MKSTNRILPAWRPPALYWLRALPVWMLLVSVPSVATLEPGSLEIRTEPEVEVIWEGAALGQTDAAGVMAIRGIPQGRYSVLLRKAGFEDREIDVQIGPGENSLVVKMPPPAPAVQDRASPTPPPEPPTSARRAAEAEPDREQGGARRDPTSEAEVGPEVAPVPKQATPETDRPAAESSQPLTDPAGSRQRALLWGGTGLALAIVALSLLLLLRRRSGRQQTYEPHPPPPTPDFIGPITVRKTEDPQEFLSNLRQRENARDHGATGRRLIDIESFEAGSREDEP